MILQGMKMLTTGIKNFLSYILKLVLVSAFAALGTFMFLEISTRVLVPKIYWQHLPNGDFLEWDKETGWKYKNNLDLEWIVEGAFEFKHDRAHFKTGEDGLRVFSTDHLKSETKIKILLMGDSTVANRTVPFNKSYEKRLGLRFANFYNSDVLVHNIAVEGFNLENSLFL